MSEQITEVDLLIVGGGINGCGIARDAAGRGLSVILCEKDDIAAHTSSYSTKLIHGGLRYLEFYEFSMVREALGEREVLMNIAPHLIWPLTFVLPHANHLRPAWMIRLGLFLYDHLGKRERLEASKKIDLQRHVAGDALKAGNKVAFSYADCATLDSRLTLLNAADAAEKGASILTHTKCVSAVRRGGHWQVELENEDGIKRVQARALVNATGPWVGDFIKKALKNESRYSIRLVQGSHIVVKKLFSHDYAYIFQNEDKRIVFAIPYEKEFTLVGTTDQEYNDDPNCAKISENEIDYLCDLINRYFRRQISPQDVVWTYSGVRPLFDDHSSNASRVTREYVLDLEEGEGENDPPLLNIFGGKLTSYRQLAEKSLNMLLPILNISAPDWTATQPLPGGDFSGQDFRKFFNELKSKYGWMDDRLLFRYARQFGSRIKDVLKNAGSIEELGQYFGAGLYEREVTYLIEKEWAKSAEDVLWRRTRQGLWAESDTSEALQKFMSKQTQFKQARGA